jgi:radical SAM superfamily enzyme with C-terminal helix-hairpin-helix motif
VLHTDNANPLTITRFPDAAAEAMEIIVRHNTAGDGLSFGLENVSARVKNRNHLKVSAEEALFAVRMVNEIGGKPKGPRLLPALLPGLNFLVGLADDGDDSLEENRRFLETLLEEGLLVRRINIRRCMVFPEAPLASLLERYPSRVRERSYRRWKEWIRNEADPVFLSGVAPVGTVIRNVRVEERRGHMAFGRSLGSYPPLVGIGADDLREGDRRDVVVCGHGGRSLTAVPYPVDLNRCDPITLQTLPGIGKARASRIIQRRPIYSLEELPALLDAPAAIIEALRPFLS